MWDAVKLATKPALVGRVAYFTVAQPDARDGPHAGGRVTVAPVPASLWGGATRTLPLRRLEGAATDADVADAEAREAARAPESLRLDPLSLVGGAPLRLAAGGAVPETAATVLAGGGGSVTRCTLAGERVALAVVQRLWFCGETGAGESGESGGGATAAAPPPPSKKGRKRKAAKEGAVDDDDAPAAAATTTTTTAPSLRSLVCEVENRTPARDGAFRFARITDGTTRAGTYELEFEVAPAPPGGACVRATVRVVVAPGAATRAAMRGAGRGAAAAAPLPLGAPLPPLEVTFVDAHGNDAPPPPQFAVGGVRVAVHAARGENGDDDATPGPRLDDMLATADVAAAPHGATLSRVRVMGAPGATGLALFAEAAAGAAARGARAAAAAGTQAAQPTATQAAAVPPPARAVLVISVPGDGESDTVTLPVTLVPGAPVSLALVGGHPWPLPSSTPAPPLALAAGAPLPAFAVTAADAWGTPTAPSRDLPFDLSVECAALDPPSSLFSFAATGVARADGMDAAAGTVATGGPHDVVLSLVTRPATPAAAAAVDAAGALTALALPLTVEPSRAPASLQLLLNGEPLPAADAASATAAAVDGDGDGPAARLDGVPAGKAVTGLSVCVVDEAGRPVTDAAPGKLQVSWMRGHKKVDVAAGDAALPPLDAPEVVGDAAAFWVRLKVSGGGPVLEAGLLVASAPGPPATWSLRLAGNDGDDSAPRVGVPFCVDVEALDARGNRCPRSAAGRADLPDPVLVPVPSTSGDNDGATTLAWDEATWTRAWAPASASSGGAAGDVHTITLTLTGPSVRVALHARDAGGRRGASRLTPDALEVDVGPGVPARLVLDPLPHPPRGLAPTLPRVVARVLDGWGNTVPLTGPDVALAPGALADDGSGRAAKVVARGRAALADGVAVFTDVKLAADDGPGTYAVRVKPASRSLAAEFGELAVTLARVNTVSSVSVSRAAAPPGPLTAGDALTLVVDVVTDDGEPLAAAVAAAGLTLCVTSPSGDRVACMAATPVDGDAAAFSVTTDAGLTEAGTYSAAAEYAETRDELGGGGPLRSPAVEIAVAPGAAAALAPDPRPTAPTLTAATRGDVSSRSLFPGGVAFQLVDAHGNPVAERGARVMLRLEAVGSTRGGGGGDSHLPTLDTPAAAPVATDAAGRAFFARVAVAEGTGPLAGGPPLDLRLIASVAPSRRGAPVDGWSAPALITPDGAGADELRAASSARARRQKRRATRSLPV